MNDTRDIGTGQMDQFELLVDVELNKPDSIWDVRKHGKEIWMLYLGKKVGDLHKSVLESNHGSFYSVLIQCAAICKSSYYFHCTLTNDPFDMLVRHERLAQDGKWGEQNHGPEKWLMILGEEYGELQETILHGKPLNYVIELVQLAAVCKSIWECSCLNNWP